MSNTAGGWFTNTDLDHYHPVTILHLVVTRCRYKAIERQQMHYENNFEKPLEIINVFFVKFCIHDLTKVL